MSGIRCLAGLPASRWQPLGGLPIIGRFAIRRSDPASQYVMVRPEEPSGATTLPLEDSRVQDKIKRIHEYVWARHVDGSDHYDHSIDDAEARATLDAHYSGIGNRNSPDQVYLGILLFEQGFELADEEQVQAFDRARKIFEFYRRVTSEDDWPAVEDRLEDINSFFADRGEEQTPEAPVAEPVAHAPVAVQEPVAEEAEPAIAVAEVAPAAVAEVAPVVEEPVAPPPTPVAVPTPEAEPVASAAEAQERKKAEAAAARREAAEAFIADLEVVEGMALIPAGTFIYGEEGEEIFLDTYYIDNRPVTNGEYNRFVRETGYRPPRYVNDARLNQPDQPVVGVGYSDARQYAKWAGKELPTEQQWEKAARGTDGRPYPWGNEPPGKSDACFGLDATSGAPVAVGRALRNVSPFGVQDVCGNVWEWTQSAFAKDSEFNVVRGGSYNDPAPMLALDFRLEAHPKDKCEAIGFRCVKNIH